MRNKGRIILHVEKIWDLDMAIVIKWSINIER
jgi:hypothetical protein